MSNVQLDVQGHVGIITLNRPPINALTFEMYEEINDTFSSINEMDEVRVVILRADGNMFSAGNDVNEFTTVQNRFTEYIETIKSCVSAVYSCRVPVIAMVHGYVMGAGLALAACCDMLVASEDAEFGIPEIKVGLIGAAEFADLLVPRKVLNYMALSGNPVSAREIAQYGGIHQVVPKDELMDAAMGIANELLEVAPVALMYFKEALQTNLDANLLQKYTHEMTYTEKYLETDDFKEAITAFIEKRKPVYQGK